MPKHISADCQDILKRMICVDPSKRITAKECLNHPWIVNSQQKKSELPPEEEEKLEKSIVQKLMAYRGQSLLKKASMNVLVKHLSSKQVEMLRSEFEKFDIDKSGTLELNELTKAIQHSGVELSEEDIKKIVKEVDYGENG